MSRDNDSFWADVFRKSPLIGLCMAVCGIVGLACGSLYFHKLLQFFRVYLCAIAGCTLFGIFVGLCIGVGLDSLFGPLFRKDRKKKRDRNRWRVD